MTLEERLEKAAALRAAGYNCAQATILPFAEETGLDADVLTAATSALGTGVAAQREVCGVANAIAIARGLINAPLKLSKKEASDDAARHIGIFRTSNGAIRCAELKSLPGCRTCNELVAQGVEILHNSLND